jgi:hypothetical protein
MVGGALLKIGIGGFFVFASAQMGSLAKDLLDRARESVQASEMLTLDSHLAVWTIEQKRGRPPRDQKQFQSVCKQLFTARGGRDVTKDRWGMVYVYEPINVRPVEWRISSLGPDKKLGTDDDLIVHRRSDTVQINKDPTEIIEAAIERLRRVDEQRLRELERLQQKQGKQPPVFEKDEQGVKLDPLQKRALKQQLAELDALLKNA